MFQWKKLGLVFSPKNYDTPFWMHEFAQAPSVIVFEDLVRVYFSCRPKPDENRLYTSYSAYVDLDRKDLFRIVNISKEPILQLGKLGTFDEFGIYPVSVIKDDSNFRVYYAGWTRCESVPFNVAIGAGFSEDDGQTFKKYGEGPVLSYTPNEPFILSGPKIRKFNGIWYLFYIAGRKWILDNEKPEPIYKIRMATSNDGLKWNKLDKDIINFVIDNNEAQASPDVILLNGIYHMFFCYRHSTNYRGKENGYRIGYAYSNDLLNWTRDDSKVGIDVSESGWDSEMISYPHVFELDGEIYMFYLGNEVGKQGFGLAHLKSN